jgi:hypothetical protein
VQLTKAVLTGLLMGASGLAQAGTWTELSLMPAPRWYHAAGVGSDDKLYVYGGYVNLGKGREDARGAASLVIYDPATDTWQPGPEATRKRIIIRGERRDFGTGSSPDVVRLVDRESDNRIEVELPAGRADPHGRMYWLSKFTWTRFDPGIGSWDFPFPPVRADNPNWKPDTGVPGTLWVEHAPQFLRYSPTTATVGSLVYVTGGLAEPLTASKVRAMVHASAEVYEADTGTWRLLPEMHQKRYLHAASETRDGKVCVFGGSAAEPSMMQEPGESGESYDRRAAENRPLASVSLASVECYDPKTNAWSERAPLPTPRQAMGAALGADGKIYVVGGAPSYAHPKPMDVVDVYDPEADTWSPGPPLGYPRRGHAVVSTKEGKIYAIGGWVGPPARSVLGKLLGPKVDRPLGATVEVLDTKVTP